MDGYARGEMRKEQRAVARMELDKCQRLFRRAGELNRYRRGWLRDVRQALGIPAAELAQKLKVNPSVFFRLEERERRKRASMGAVERMAEAMGCKLVYAIVPKRGTLEEMAFDREWAKRREKDGDRD